MKNTLVGGIISGIILPSYIGILINHCKIERIPINQPVYWKVVRVFFVAQLGHDEIHQSLAPGVVPGAQVAKFALRSGSGRRIIARFLEPPRASGGSSRLGKGWQWHWCDMAFLRFEQVGYSYDLICRADVMSVERVKGGRTAR